MKHIKQMIFVLLLAALLCAGWISAAAETALPASGTCGAPGNEENVTWSLSAYGRLTIEGDGAMADQGSAGEYPWSAYIDSIKTVSVGYGVTNLGRSAFENAPALTTATVSTKVTSIGESAFRGCEALTDVTLGVGVKTIGDGAFAGCAALRFLSLPGGLRTLGQNVFAGTGLRAIYIPATLETNHDAFDQAPDLSYVFYGGSESQWQNVGGLGMDLGWNDAPITKNTLACGFCGDPQSGDETDLVWWLLQDGALTIRGDGRMPVSYPWNVGSPWRKNAGSVRNVTVESGVAGLAESAFAGCANLKSITLPEQITEIPNSTFSGCTSLASVRLPARVTRIGGSAFNGCKSLTEILLPDTLTSICGSAFADCTALKEISMPDSVQTLGEWTFSGSGLTSVVLPGSLQLIPPRLFENCTELKEVAIGPNVQKIDLEAFFNTALTTLSLPASVKSFSVSFLPHTLTSFSVAAGNPLFSAGTDGALYNKTKTKLVRFPENHPAALVRIPEGVTEIGENAFKECDNMTAVILPDTVKTLNENAFLRCDALESVTIPGSVGYLPYWSFYGCAALKEVTLMPGVKTVAKNAFGYCDALEKVWLPATLESIGAIAFDHATNSDPDSTDPGALTDVYYAGDETAWNAIQIGEPNFRLHNALLHYNAHYYHTPGEEITENRTEPTCTEEGGYDTVIYCTGCDYEFSRAHVTLDPTGHTPGEAAVENRTAPTCTEDGGYDTVIYCIACDYEFSRAHVTLDPTGHSWGAWQTVKEATVTEEGLMQRVCANDPSHIETQPIPKQDPPTEDDRPKNPLEKLIDFFRELLDWFRNLFS